MRAILSPSAVAKRRVAPEYRVAQRRPRGHGWRPSGAVSTLTPPAGQAQDTASRSQPDHLRVPARRHCSSNVATARLATSCLLTTSVAADAATPSAICADPFVVALKRVAVFAVGLWRQLRSGLGPAFAAGLDVLLGSDGLEMFWVDAATVGTLASQFARRVVRMAGVIKRLPLGDRSNRSLVDPAMSSDVTAFKAEAWVAVLCCSAEPFDTPIGQLSAESSKTYIGIHFGSRHAREVIGTP